MTRTQKSKVSQKIYSGDEDNHVGLLDQYQLILFASKDTRLTACDLAVLIEIVDRYLKAGNSTRPTGKTHLQRETGRSEGAVKNSRRRLETFGYLSVSAAPKGTRGTQYHPNFCWSRAVAAVVSAEVKARKEMKPRGALRHPPTTSRLGGGAATPLRDLVGWPDDPLGNLEGQSRAPQTYVGPTSPYVGGAGAPPDGVPPPVGTAPRLVEIVGSEVRAIDGGNAFVAWLEDEDGEQEEIVINLESADKEVQDHGQKRFNSLLYALYLNSVDDVEELHFLPFLLTVRGEFLRAPARQQVA